jgi:hypothetical protein
MTTDILLVIMTGKRQTRSLVREGAHKDKTVTVKLNLISGHEPQMGLDTKTD